MTVAKIRRIVTVVEETLMEIGRTIDPPTRRAAALAVIENPFAGRYQEDLEALMAVGEEMGGLLGARAVAALGIAPSAAESYGKAAIVGVGGDLEHGHAMLHPMLGKALHEPIGGGKAIIPSVVKVTAAGATIDIPLGHKDDLWSFDHFDAMPVAVPDGPRPNEILMAIAITDGGRPVPRVGKARAAD